MLRRRVEGIELQLARPRVDHVVPRAGGHTSPSRRTHRGPRRRDPPGAQLDAGLSLFDADELVPIGWRSRPMSSPGASRITVSCVLAVNRTVRNVSFSSVCRSISPSSRSWFLLRSHPRWIEALRSEGLGGGGGGNRTPVAGRPSGSSPGAAGGEISPRGSHRRRTSRPARVRCPSEAPGRNLLGESCLRCPVRAAGPPGRTAT